MMVCPSPPRSDLKIGGMLNVYNRMLLLHDCDAFTKQFYIEQRGRSPDEFRPVLMECTPPAASPSLHPGCHLALWCGYL
jgi:hypothetical protein